MGIYKSINFLSLINISSFLNILQYILQFIYEAVGDLWLQSNDKKHWLTPGDAVPSTVTYSWTWDSQAVEKNCTWVTW